MPDIDWNRSLWERQYNWNGRGEEWSLPWGGSEAQWFGALLPRLHRFLPARRILEIAPGYGRWTRFLLDACGSYLGVDLAENCVSACRNRFADASHAHFICNDGRSLEEVQDEGFDLVFSFDSLVHAELTVLESYVPQIIRKLQPGGVAFIHHSNLAAIADTTGLNDQARAFSVSGSKVADLIDRSGGKILIQEVIDWLETGPIDCLTTFGRAEDHIGRDPVEMNNSHFMEAAALIREFQSPYGRLPRQARDIVADPPADRLKYRFAIAACARWESDSILEWITYHRLLGFEHIYLYCNDDDPTELYERLGPSLVGTDPYVTFVHYPFQGMQMQMYKHFLKHYVEETEWFIFLDIDEFLAIKNFTDINEFMRIHKPWCDALYFNWVFFGHNKFEDRPTGSVLLQYTSRDSQVNHFTKMLTRTASLDIQRIIDESEVGFWHDWTPRITG